jgi:hypothetical protein
MDASIDQVVVVTHRGRPEGWHPEAPFHFVDGVEAAGVGGERPGDHHDGGQADAQRAWAPRAKQPSRWSSTRPQACIAA